MNEKVISYDLGTGGIKASLFNRNGEALHSVFIPYPTVYPQPGWQEQAPKTGGRLSSVPPGTCWIRLRSIKIK